jgi:hypothetical protein
MPFEPGFHKHIPGYRKISFKPSTRLLSDLNSENAMLSQNPRAVSARERKAFNEATELERHRREMKEKIAKCGPDYRNWPESKPKIEGEPL